MTAGPVLGLAVLLASCPVGAAYTLASNAPPAAQGASFVDEAVRCPWRSHEPVVRCASDTVDAGRCTRFDELGRKRSETIDYSSFSLTSAARPQGPTEQFTWDPMSNLLSTVDAPGPWLYDTNSRLLTDGTRSWAYDPNGNATTRPTYSGTTQLSWDVNNRLARVSGDQGTIIAEYRYDPFGRRLWKDVGGNRTYYAYADEGLVGEYDASGQELRAYGWAPDSAWSSSPLFLRQGDTFYWYHNDVVGRPQLLTDSSGTIAWSATYSAFGESTILTSSVPNPFRGAGQYHDDETGLLYNCNRFYDPTLGRYLSPDPLGTGPNPYDYALANPLRYTDPKGLCVVKKAFVDPFRNIFDFGLGAYALATQGVPEGMEMGFNGGFGDLGIENLIIPPNIFAGYGLYDKTSGELLAENRLNSQDVGAAAAAVTGALGGLGGAGAATAGGVPRFTQTTASALFKHGPFAGRSIGEVAAGLRSGAISPSQLPVGVIVRGGNILALNTRSSLALTRAGIHPSQWSIINRTGDAFFENLLRKRLLRNGLTDAGTETLRVLGAGENASAVW